MKGYMKYAGTITKSPGWYTAAYNVCERGTISGDYRTYDEAVAFLKKHKRFNTAPEYFVPKTPNWQKKFAKDRAGSAPDGKC